MAIFFLFLAFIWVAWQEWTTHGVHNPVGHITEWGETNAKSLARFAQEQWAGSDSYLRAVSVDCHEL